MRAEIVVKAVSPYEPSVSAFIDELDRYQQSLYPAESNHLDSRDTLMEVNCRLLAASIDGRILGIGAAEQLRDRSGDEYAELKRFFIPESARGLGVGECLIGALEKWLLDSGVPYARLETGIHQHSALRFYEKLGYSRLAEPFGEYKVDPLSVFMEKKLDPREAILRAHAGGYHVVAFTSRLRPGVSAYDDVAAQMVRRAQEQAGFLGMHSTRNSAGDGFTASYWRDRESISAWGRDPEHREAQRLGREVFYEKFRIATARIESD